MSVGIQLLSKMEIEAFNGNQSGYNRPPYSAFLKELARGRCPVSGMCPHWEFRFAWQLVMKRGDGTCLVYFCFLAVNGFPPPQHPSPCSRIRKTCLDSQGDDFWFPSGCFCPGP